MLNRLRLWLVISQLIPLSAVRSWMLVLSKPLLVVIVKEHVRLVSKVVILEVYQILVQIFHFRLISIIIF